MRKSIYKINIIRIFSLIAVLFIVGYLFSPKNFDGIARAGAGDALSGYAWSENIGWISFNCTNNNSCGTSGNYGVNVSTTNLSGYAWSENIGWITFNSAELSGCPSG